MDVSADTKNEILTGLNKPEDFILALVLVPSSLDFQEGDPWQVKEARFETFIRFFPPFPNPKSKTYYGNSERRKKFGLRGKLEQGDGTLFNCFNKIA